MKLGFDSRIQQARKEYRKYMQKRHVGKLRNISEKIRQKGFQSVGENNVKHLWDDIYEVKPYDRRVIYVKMQKDRGIILKVYVKKSNKMPKHIKDSIMERAILLKR